MTLAEAPPPLRRKARPETDAAIHEAITRAILDGRLRAGTRLAENPLAAIFGVSRERVRKVLHRLAAERRLEIVPNRGARVPSPTPDDVRATYVAHRVLEAGILAQLARDLKPETLALLDVHLRAEHDAAERGDRAQSVRLSGAFHIHLADALGNAEISRFLRDLLSRSSVMVSLYEPAAQSACAVDEHGAIVEALRARDAERAIALSHAHFAGVESRLRLAEGNPPDADLKSIFGRPKR